MARHKLEMNTHKNYRTEGNLAVKVEIREDDRNYAKHIKRRARRAADRALQKKVLRNNRIRTGMLATAAAMAIISVSAFLAVSSENSTLTANITSLENQIATLTEQNDSKEYDITSSMDLDYVIEVATKELGMVRSNASQIVTFEDTNAEYVQQLSEIPTE